MNNPSHIARLTVYTDDFLEGSLHVGIKAGGHTGRISDVLNDEADFIVLTDVALHETGSGKGMEEPLHQEIIILRKGEIQFVIPFD